MGCGSSSASAPGKFSGEDEDLLCEGQHIRFNKKTGQTCEVDQGKDEDCNENCGFEVEEAVGEQFMAVRPWLGQVCEPDNHNPQNDEQPDCTYCLEYVYGYRCADSKQNVFWNNNCEAVYMTAALGVILDPTSNCQKFFGGGEVDSTAKNVANDMNCHTDDILAISLNPCKMLAATGQVGASPTIFTWDPCTGEKKCRIKIAKGARGINAISLNDECWIAAVDLHNEHQVYVYDNNGQCVFKEKGDTNKIHDVAWDCCPGSKKFVTVGVKHIYFWDASVPGGDKRRGLFGSFPQTSFACAAWAGNGKVFAGGANGKVYVFNSENRTCEAVIEGHKNGCFVSAMASCNGSIFSGGKDGKLQKINPDTLQVENSADFCFVRAIDVDKDMQCLVGQRDGCIIKHNPKTGESCTIMNSHCEGEVWGLACSPDGKVWTSGDDNKVMCWDPSTRKMDKCMKVSDRVAKAKRGGASTLSKMPDSQCSRSIAINNEWMAIAGNDGCVSIRACNNCEVESCLLKDSSEWIEVMSFSPDGQYLAVGSHDNRIYVYQTGTWNLVGKCVGHSSYIMALDWCRQSQYIRSNCGAYELLFWTVPDCKQDPSGRTNTKGTMWATKTVKFSWETTGIYPKGTDGTHINSVCGSNDGCLLATGDDYGLVNIFRDPCIKGRPRCFRGHSEHVVRVLFSADDGYIFSVGGYDQTLMQWKKQC